MIIAITGTPGTGKTSVAKALSRKLGWLCISLNELAEEEGLYKGYDRKRRCKIVDVEKLKEEVKILGVSHKNIIIESHYAHDMPADVVIVLRTNPRVLRERMEKKGWHTEKIDENIEAEIMGVIKEEAYMNNINVYEIDTTNTTPEEAAEKIMKIIREQSVLITKDLKIPEFIIPELRKPFGELIKGKTHEEVAKKVLNKLNRKNHVIVVGDRASYYLTKAGCKPDMIIVDGMSERREFGKRISFKGMVIRVKNPRGWISVEMWKAVQNSVKYLGKKKIKIVIEGEEDLAVLPCALHSPEGTQIIYGLFEEGLVLVKLDKKKKEHAKAILDNIIYAQ